MRQIIIAAFDKNRVIGLNNRLPWHLPADLQYFKKITEHKPMIMGHSTFKSFGKPLPNRQHIVLSRQPKNILIDGVIAVDSYASALEKIAQQYQEVMIIGGQQIYQLALEHATDMYLTEVDGEFEGDTYFPAWSVDDWQLVSKESFAADKKNAYSRTNFVYKRIRY